MREPAFRASNVIRPLGNSALALLSQLVANALLQDLKSVFGVLGVEFRDLADAAHANQDSLVLDQGRLWSEAGHHADTLATAEGFEGLVLDVSSLEDNGGSL